MSLTPAIMSNPRELRKFLEKSPDTYLMGITRQKYDPRDKWIDRAIEMITVPRFFYSAQPEGLFFGCIQTGFNMITPAQIIKNIQSFTSFHLMTLRETAPQIYRQVTADLPQAAFLVNRTRGEYVNFYRQPRSYVSYVRERWPSTDRVVILMRPFNYKNRDYVDKTEELLEKGLFPTVEMVDNPSTEIEIEDNSREDDSLRNSAQNQVNQEIRDRLLKRYPNIDLIKQIVRHNHPVMSYHLDLNFILPVVYLPQNGLSYDTRTRIVWRTELLPNPSNPSGEEMAFFEIMADLVDYIK